MRKDIVLFTGPSGIKVENCLEKIKKKAPKQNVEILRVQEEMVRLYKEKNTSRKTLNTRAIFTEILALPPFEQAKIWESAFSVIIEKLEDRKDKARCFLLAFHTCFYHQEKREFLSPINMRKLYALQKRIKAVIVFVDDCYDIYKRLLNEGEMFYYSIMTKEVTKQDAMIKSVFNLFSILSWREMEIAFSRMISEMLDVPMFIIAVKHPTFMVSRLVFRPFERLRIFYLAHPITSVRARTYVRGSRFPIEVNNFIEKAIKTVENAVLFIPDTIDELRIMQKDKDGYTDELLEGWCLPFEEDDWLFSSLPTKVKNLNPLNPKEFKYSERDDKRNTMSYAIRILADKINEQITSRDFSLVEQAKDGIIVFQPYWNGNISRGAQREAEYNLRLKCDFGQKKRRTYILDKQENLGKYRLGFIFLTLESRCLKNILSEKQKKELTSLCEKWQKDPNTVSKFYKSDWKLEGIRDEIEKVIPENYDFSNEFLPPRNSTLRGGTLIERRRRLSEGWRKLAKETKATDPFEEYCLDPQGEYLMCSSDKFEKKLREFFGGLALNLKKEGANEEGELFECS